MRRMLVAGSVLCMLPIAEETCRTESDPIGGRRKPGGQLGLRPRPKVFPGKFVRFRCGARYSVHRDSEPDSPAAQPRDLPMDTPETLPTADQVMTDADPLAWLAAFVPHFTGWNGLPVAVAVLPRGAPADWVRYAWAAGYLFKETCAVQTLWGPHSGTPWPADRARWIIPGQPVVLLRHRPGPGPDVILLTYEPLDGPSITRAPR